MSLASSSEKVQRRGEKLDPSVCLKRTAAETIAQRNGYGRKADRRTGEAVVRLSHAALRACPFRFSLLKIRPCDSRASSVRSAPPFPCHSLPRAPRPRRLCHAIPSKCTFAFVALSYLLYQGFTLEQCDKKPPKCTHKRTEIPKKT